ncbi:MAG: glycosyltransferase family 4 protein [Methylobacteriaceae bacterium]|nr:glycosyltransferase family 4 protein [Methylobacteriaceae bacterium]
MTPRRIAVVAYTDIARDARVRRTADSLAAAGHEIVVIGFGADPAARWRFEPLPDLGGLGAQRLALLATQAPANLAPWLAPWLHLVRRHHRAARAKLIALRPHVIHANDWIALPACAQARRATGARLVYDSHEVGVEEHADNWRWRLVSQNSARATERRFIDEADAVVTVGEGVAEALAALYPQAPRPVVVRNAPRFVAVAPAPAPDGRRRLLYHGVLKQGRGVEAAIEAVGRLPDCELTIRGGGAPAYVEGLRRLAAAGPAATRIAFEPPVAPDQVVAAAASSHIGLFCAPLDTGQNRLAMPNKFFEYAMAGLAVVAAEGSELGALVRRLDCGVCAPAATGEAIAGTLAALDDARLAQLRANALAAGRAFSWEQEEKTLLAVYERLV